MKSSITYLIIVLGIIFITNFIHTTIVTASSSIEKTCNEEEENNNNNMASAVKTMRAVVAEAGKLITINRPVPIAKKG